ncbi:MAG: 2-succinyl-6-hydroxy-2,4-cyclohexadiene-1-carboxylate synthase [Alphaproteobacteria bacterium]|nr:2-succinyl-6-hydroxy-2,4-cyclohexadiene-1-carboxylate synthase [Alphaproteobacteria bacterium]MCB9795982.1 2-succinyl-6-hydroxy-2,4-cyclohexadiene-1-carboxylate synthase [Alphaproteobacteria bacterium]
MSLARWPGAAPGLLALHGFTGSGQDFAPFAEALGRRVLAPDLPGHGAAAASPATLAASLHALRPLLDEAPVLLGYSLGGRLALHLALERPPEALVLIGASPGLETEAARAARRDADEALAIEITEKGIPAFAQAWARVPIIATQARIPEPWRSEMAARRLLNTPSGLAASLRGLGTGALPSLWDRLGALHCPTLLLVGEEDLKFRDIAARMAARLPRAEQVLIPGAGHCAHLEQPRASARAVADFLAAH